MISFILKEAINYHRLVKVRLRDVRSPLYGWIEPAVTGFSKNSDKLPDWLSFNALKSLDKYMEKGDDETIKMPLPKSRIAHIEIVELN